MIIIIAAISKNNVLGKDNDLIWYLPADLKRFKEITLGHHIIMGRKTFDSIGRPLPNRKTIIITRDKKYSKKDCLVANSIEAAIDLASGDEMIFIIGGAQIYKQVLEKDLVDKLEITIVDKEFEGDVFFPKIDKKKWKKTSTKNFKADQNNKMNYSFVTYKKITF